MRPEESIPALVTLHIGEFYTHVQGAGGAAGAAGEVRVIQIGFLMPGAALSHSPPTALELENAIAAVEDLVMPLAAAIPRAARLAISDPLAHRIAGLGPGGDTPGGMLGIDVVESLFNDMAAVALGRPSSASPFLDKALCGYLLILREFMHHLGFSQVVLRPAA